MSGFHAGELEVQERAGTRRNAAQLVGMLAPPDLHAGVVGFLSTRRFATISARDGEGRLWVSALEGPEGFLDAGPDWLSIRTAPAPGDPLHRLPAGQSVGLIAIDFATRRRFRMNGTLVTAGDDGLAIALTEAYGNCPKYIHPRTLQAVPAGSGSAPADASTALTEEQAELIRTADTFFLGTTHPDRGNDASHRGGPAGFVRVEDGTLWWPDFAGNEMFNSFGNLAVDDHAALFFADWDTGETLHLSGRAAVEWNAATDTGRAVRFTIEAVRAGVPLRHRAA